MKDLIAALQSLTLPWDATTGMRIVLDGVNGRILFYDAANELVLSAAPGDGTDPDGNDIERGFTTYNSAANTRATLDSGTIGVRSMSDPDFQTILQQGRLYITEDGGATDGMEINFDADEGFNLKRLNTTRTSVWNGHNGYWYAGTGFSFDIEDWTALGIIPGWGNSGAPYTDAEYKLGSDGRVYLRGMINGGALADGTLVAGMPAAYAPPDVSVFPVTTQAPAVHGGVTIDSTGSINIYGGITSISFEGISYSIV